jgi:MATE family multidrug resistance protein
MGSSKPERLVSKCGDDRRDSISDVTISGLTTEAGGYREVIRIALPLVLSTASLTLMLFVDRMFLSWYGQDSVAAATPGGITYFTICSLFLGTAQYVNTIVAQYHGSGDKPACARAVWQGVFFSVAVAPLILASIPIGKIVFTWSGHGAAVSELEKQYFSILMVGGVMLPLNAALSSFFSGRGRTAVVMWGNLAGNAVNFVLAYVLIFGKLGFPEMGIWGAGLATAISGAIPALYWGFVFLSPRYQAIYRTRKEFRWDSKLLLMLLRYGVPSGVQFFLDIASFTMFILLVGRLGEADLAATNIALSIEMLAFLPMVGMSIATATLVGEYIGQGRPEIAQKSVYSALKLAMAYTAIPAVLYLLVPDFLLELFRPAAPAGQGFEPIMAKGVVLVRLIAIYTLFDTMFIVFSGALKGAGDTQFAMWAQVLMAWIFFVPPVYLIVEYFHVGLFAAWSWVLVYVVALGLIFWLRFRSGYWKTIRMVERFPA